MPLGEWLEHVHREITGALTLQLAAKALHEEELARAWSAESATFLKRLLRLGGGQGVRTCIKLDTPVIAVGAPVGAYFSCGGSRPGGAPGDPGARRGGQCLRRGDRPGDGELRGSRAARQARRLRRCRRRDASPRWRRLSPLPKVLPGIRRWQGRYAGEGRGGGRGERGA
jgi:hypothetical protein